MLATETDACREYARNVGMDDPTREWICTPFDSWERNPFYTGVPGKHPEDDWDSDFYTEPVGTVVIEKSDEIPF